MSERQTMNTVIHAALRRDLARFATALADFPAGSRARADQLTAAWGYFSAQLHDHHRAEETIFFPAFRELGADGSLIDELDAEHGAMLTALQAAGESMRALHSEPSAEHAATACRAIAQLNAILHAHLDHEERNLEPFAARHASAPQLKRAQAAVRTANKGSMGTFLAWLTDRADPSAITALRRQIPRPVLFVLTRAGGRRYRRDTASAWS